MKPVIFLRIASVLTFVHSALHTIGGVFGKVEPGAPQTAVEAMKANPFLVMGLTRTYWSFYRGLGLGISIFLIVEAVVFWQLSSLARSNSYRLRSIYATFMVGYLLFALNSYEYFFLPPVVTEILIALCLGLAIVVSKPPSADIADKSLNASQAAGGVLICLLGLVFSFAWMAFGYASLHPGDGCGCHA